MVKPLIAKFIPIGTPAIETLIQLAVVSLMVIVPVNALPTLPDMAGATIVGPRALIVILNTAAPLRAVTLSLAVTVTAYVPATGLAQLTRPALLIVIPDGALLKTYVTGSTALTTTLNDNAVPAVPLILAPVTAGGAAAATAML